MAQPSDLSNVWQANNQAMQNRYNAPANAINSATQYFANQQNNIQQLQIQQASDLSKAHIMASQYYPQAVPTIENMMSNNPYARRAFPGQQGQGLGQLGQMGGNPNMFAGMIGAPGANAYGQGMYPTNPDGTADSSAGGGGGLNLSPVVASATMGGGKPPEYTVKNLAATQQGAAAESSGGAIGKAAVPGAVSQGAAAGSYGEKMGAEQAQANVGAVRDNTQLNQMAMSLKNILDLHGQLSDRGLAGSGLNAAFTEGVYNNIPNIPAMGVNNPQKALTNPKTQELLGRFTSSRNENMVRFQPQLSQQYGAPGSIRIMDSLIQLAGGEIPSLETPHDQAIGNVAGTIRSLYIFQKSTDAYAQHLQAIGAKMPQNPQDYINGVTPYVNQFKASLSPEETKELGTLTNQVTGKLPSVAQGVSVNQVTNHYSPSTPLNQSPISQNPNSVMGYINSGLNPIQATQQQITQHPFLSTLQPAAKTITGQSLQDTIDKGIQNIPSLGQSSSRPYDKNLGMVAPIAGTASLAGAGLDIATTPSNYIAPPILKAAWKAAQPTVESLIQKAIPDYAQILNPGNSINRNFLSEHKNINDVYGTLADNGIIIKKSLASVPGMAPKSDNSFGINQLDNILTPERQNQQKVLSTFNSNVPGQGGTDIDAFAQKAKANLLTDPLTKNDPTLQSHISDLMDERFDDIKNNSQFGKYVNPQQLNNLKTGWQNIGWNLGKENDAIMGRILGSTARNEIKDNLNTLNPGLGDALDQSNAKMAKLLEAKDLLQMTHNNNIPTNMRNPISSKILPPIGLGVGAIGGNLIHVGGDFGGPIGGGALGAKLGSMWGKAIKENANDPETITGNWAKQIALAKTRQNPIMQNPVMRPTQGAPQSTAQPPMQQPPMNQSPIFRPTPQQTQQYGTPTTQRPSFGQMQGGNVRSAGPQTPLSGLNDAQLKQAEKIVDIEKVLRRK